MQPPHLCCRTRTPDTIFQDCTEGWQHRMRQPEELCRPPDGLLHHMNEASTPRRTHCGQAAHTGGPCSGSSGGGSGRSRAAGAGAPLGHRVKGAREEVLRCALLRQHPLLPQLAPILHQIRRRLLHCAGSWCPALPTHSFPALPILLAAFLNRSQEQGSLRGMRCCLPAASQAADMSTWKGLMGEFCT